VRAFKAEFVKRFKVWGSAQLENCLRQLLHTAGGLSAMMMRRRQIAAAACEPAVASTPSSLCERACVVTGHSDYMREFLPDRPLANRYVMESPVDPERDGVVVQTRRP
jgi:hypothetical protein